MITFTTLAESKCAEPLSEQVRPSTGSLTHRATVDARPRRASRMSLPRSAASLGCDDDAQVTVAAA